MTNNKKMHADEIDVTLELVRQLVDAQFPEYVSLPLSQVQSAGTDNAMFRLGDTLVVRLPRIPSAAQQIEKEQRWLSHLHPHLPLEIPTPVHKGSPTETYPFTWSIYQWIDGDTVSIHNVNNQTSIAESLAGFLSALQKVDTTDAPLPGKHNFGRGVPLAERDAATRKAIDSLADMLDTDILHKAWDEALSAPVYQDVPVWIHGDLQAGNLLTRDDTLVAIIDFGGAAIGDPACDLQVAWNLFDKDARLAFRDTMNVSDAMWARGRGWALSVGAIALPYYKVTNPVLAGISKKALDTVIADYTHRHK
ncbi:MAG: aminoglycoside phosphotransferase family protein [Chloroflexota bacterium]